jgi:AcrR family transcriptional regulator
VKMTAAGLTMRRIAGSAAGGGESFLLSHFGSLSREKRLISRAVTVRVLRAAVWLPFRPMQDAGNARPPEPSPFGPLPPGRHPYTPEQVAHHQRERLIAGLAATVAERGYAAATVRQIAAAARVSRRVFYEHFESKEECFLAAFDAVVDHVHVLTIAAAERQGGEWPRKLSAALAAALEFLAAEPDLARLCLLESLSAGPALHRRFPEILAEFAAAMARGRGEGAGARADSADVDRLGTIAHRLTRCTASEGPERLPGQLPDLVEFLLAPRIGRERARALAREARSGSAAEEARR